MIWYLINLVALRKTQSSKIYLRSRSSLGQTICLIIMKLGRQLKFIRRKCLFTLLLRGVIAHAHGPKNAKFTKIGITRSIFYLES